MTLDDFDYTLPYELIAQQPLSERDASRLLRVDVAGQRLEDRHFRELPELVRPGDLFVFNDTRVIRARLTGRKASGGRVEVMVDRVLDDRRVMALVRASHAPLPGGRLLLDGGLEAEVLGRHGQLHEIAFDGEASVQDLLERHGELPLPPYIERQAGAEDEERYQTVYARRPGAVAAPTAGLHFTARTLEALTQCGARLCHVTLHVGSGTFQPVRVQHVAEHRMHSERYEVSPAVVEAVAEARRAGGRVFAVGTTSLRALEAAALGGQLQAGTGDTDLFITPGFRFRVVDALLTNFHLPRSTLLMLVSAFAGMEFTRRAYAHAVAQAYRFFSYGDAMLAERTPGAQP